LISESLPQIHFRYPIIPESYC